MATTLTGPGRNSLARLASDMASGPGRQVTISGIDGIWSGHLRLGHVVVADADGPWLGLRGVQLDWSPLALFGGLFSAERLHVDRIEVAHLPKSQETSAAGGNSSGGGLPIALDIARFDSPDIILGKAIAGSAVQLAANGSLRLGASPLTLTTSFHLSRVDGNTGRLDGEIAFAAADNRLTVNVTGSEPKDGILANILQLPGRPALDLTASGGGPLSDWKGTASIAANGSPLAQLSASYGQTGDGHRFAVKGNGAFGRFLPDAVRALARGNTSFDIAGMLPAKGGVALQRAELRSETISASAGGAVDPKGISDFRVDVKTPDGPVELVFGDGDNAVAMALSGAKLTISGAGQSPALDAHVALAALKAPRVTLQGVGVALGSDGFDLLKQTGPLSLELDAQRASSDIASLGPLLQGAIGAKASLEVSKDRIRIAAANVSDDVIKVTAKGDVGRKDMTVSVDVGADVASSALPAAARAPLGDRTRVSASIERSASGALSASLIKLASGGLSATGHAELSGETVDAAIKGALADVAALGKGARGTVDFNVTASGRLAAPQVVLDLSSKRIEAAGRTITGLTLTAKAEADPDKPSADVRLSGKVGSDPLSGFATLRTEGGQRQIRDLSLTLAKNSVTGNLDLDRNFVPTGRLKLSLPDIGPLAALALQKASGDLHGTVEFARTNGVPTLSVDATAGHVTRDTLQVRDARIKAQVEDYLSAPAISGTIDVAAVDAGGTKIRNAEAHFTRDGEWTRFTGKVVANDIPASAGGRVKVSAGDVTIALDTAEATVRGVKASLAKPSTITVTGGTAHFDGLQVAVGGGRAEVSGKAGQTLDLHVKLAGLPAAAANAFAKGLDAGGAVSGTVDVTGAASAPKVAYNVDWSGAVTSQTRAAGLPPIAISANGTFADSRLSIQSTLKNPAGLDLKGGGTVALSTGPSLDIAFAGRLPFSLLAGQLSSRGISLSGTSDVKVSVKGTATKPAISGNLQAKGAQFVDAQSGVAVKDIDLGVTLGGGVARIERLNGKLLAGGTVSASGTVGIDPAGAFPADLSVKLSKGRYTDGRIVTTTVDGDIALKGSLVGEPTLGGKIELGKTTITIPDSLPASLSTLDVKHRNAPAAVVRQAEALKPAKAGGGGGSGLNLDLTVDAPRQIFVRGRGLDVELGGSIKLTGNLGAPVAVGKFTLQRGRLDLLGRRLAFDSGTLGFAGSLIPQLDMKATTTIDSTTVTVEVTGAADDPKFVFSSSPSMPDDEILAQLVFGKAMSKLSPLQIAQLANSAAVLAGVGGNSSLLDKLRNATGVDDLNVTTDSGGDTAVSVGKYINDKTYLTIEKGAKSGSGKATINLDVGRGLKLRGEATESGATKGGIFFEKDY